MLKQLVPQLNEAFLREICNKITMTIRKKLVIKRASPNIPDADNKETNKNKIKLLFSCVHTYFCSKKIIE